MHPGDLAGGFSDLEMTCLLYCAGVATAADTPFIGLSADEQTRLD